MSEETKYCIDCIHCDNKKDKNMHDGTGKLVCLNTVNLVTKEIGENTCQYERNHGNCSKIGRFFQERESIFRNHVNNVNFSDHAMTDEEIKNAGKITTMYVSVMELPPPHIIWSSDSFHVTMTPLQCKTKEAKESCSVRGGACAYTKIEVK